MIAQEAGSIPDQVAGPRTETNAADAVIEMADVTKTYGHGEYSRLPRYPDVGKLLVQRRTGRAPDA